MYINAIPEAVMTFINQVVLSFYQNSVGNMGIKLHNKLLEKRKDYTHLIILKRQLKSILTYLLTPRCRFLLEKLTGLQLVKKFPTFHGTRRFITALTSVCHLSLSWASPIRSIYPHPTSWRSILILSTHLCLGLPSGLLPSGFPIKTLYTPLSALICATCPAHQYCCKTLFIL